MGISQCLTAISGIFERAEDVYFEADVNSRLTQELDQAFSTFGAAIFIPLALLTIHGKTGVVSEVLRWVGQLEDEKTIECRREVLLVGLSRQATIVRDGAVLGITSMDDPFFIAPLKATLKQEASEQLREDILQVLQQLQETKRGQADEGSSP